jgi:energy-coupling factor transporter transmembrane protein EcfT
MAQWSTVVKHRNLPPLFAWRAANTPIHALPAGIKFFALALVTIPVFSESPVILGAVSAGIVITALLARLSFANLLHNARFLAGYGLFIALFRILGRPFTAALASESVSGALYYIWQLAAILVAGSVFYETTAATEISQFLARLQRLIERAISKILCRPVDFPDIAFLLSLTITFIPRVFSAWSALNLAWEARGGTLQKGLRAALRRTVTLVPLLVISLLSVAENTAYAIRNRSA